MATKRRKTVKRGGKGVATQDAAIQRFLQQFRRALRRKNAANFVTDEDNLRTISNNSYSYGLCPIEYVAQVGEGEYDKGARQIGLPNSAKSIIVAAADHSCDYMRRYMDDGTVPFRARAQFQKALPVRERLMKLAGLDFDY